MTTIDGQDVMDDRLLTLLDEAIEDCGSLVARSATTDLGRRTPCAGWDLARLLAHVIGEFDRFAAGLRARGERPESRDDPDIDRDDVVEQWSAAAHRLRAAFAGSRPETVVHVSGFDVPAEQALRMQLLDTVVHTWDIAMACGVSYRAREDLVEFAAGLAATVAARSPEGTPGVFAAPLAAVDDPWDNTLRLLGRDPGAWLTAARR